MSKGKAETTDFSCYKFVRLYAGLFSNLPVKRNCVTEPQLSLAGMDQV